MRTVKTKIPAQKVNMGGIILDQPLPVQGVEQVDPFLLIHHWSDVLPGGKSQNETGVAPHPHRGFSPVSLIFKGAVHHRDSMGVESTVGAGGTQWMNAGKGIVHSERPEKELAENGGAFELIQFWVNTPSSAKMNDPKYQALHAEEMEVVELDEGKARIGLVAGELLDRKSQVETDSELLVLRLDIDTEANVEIPIPSNMNALVYVLDGSLSIDETELTDKDMGILENGELLKFRSNSDTRAIVLAGVPIDEPVVSYGPFVMNSQREIMDAINDYNRGEMGELTEEFK